MLPFCLGDKVTARFLPDMNSRCLMEPQKLLTAGQPSRHVISLATPYLDLDSHSSQSQEFTGYRAGLNVHVDSPKRTKEDKEVVAHIYSVRRQRNPPHTSPAFALSIYFMVNMPSFSCL